MNMMTCREVYGFLDEFLDGVLDVLTQQSFERHLERCPACRKYLTTYEATVKIARESERADEPVQTEAPDDLVQAILTSRSAAFGRQAPE